MLRAAVTPRKAINNYKKDKATPQNWESFDAKGVAHIHPGTTEFERRFVCYIRNDGSEG